MNHSHLSPKGEKMEMLYNYLISNEFRLQMDAIVEGFRGLQEAYAPGKTSNGKNLERKRETVRESTFEHQSFHRFGKRNCW